MQNKSVDFLQDINAKYTSQEYDLEEKLKKIAIEEQRIDADDASAKRATDEQVSNEPKFCKNLAEAKQRNAELIKSLEISKARLRSRATYSPLEQDLQKAILDYNAMRGVASTSSQNATTTKTSNCTRKVYGPTFV